METKEEKVRLFDILHKTEGKSNREAKLEEEECKLAIKEMAIALQKKGEQVRQYQQALKNICNGKVGSLVELIEVKILIKELDDRATMNTELEEMLFTPKTDKEINDLLDEMDFTFSVTLDK